MSSRGPHRRVAWHSHFSAGTGRITKGRSFGLPIYDWQQLSSMLTGQRQAQGVLQNTPLSLHKQPLRKGPMSPAQHLDVAGKENCSPRRAAGQAEGDCSAQPPPISSPCPAPASQASPAPPCSHTAEPETFLLQPSAFSCRRTARLRQQRGTGRATQLRRYRLLLALPSPPPPPSPPLAAPSPPPAPIPPDLSVPSPGLLPPPESPHFLTHHSPMEGVPERVTPGRPLLPPKTPLSVLPLALSAPPSPLQSSGSASKYSWPTPMEGVPERSLGLTGQRPPRPKLSPLPPTPVACTPVEGVPEILEWGRVPQAALQRNRSSSSSSRLARVLLASRGPTPAATPLLGPEGSKSTAHETPHPGSLDRHETSGTGTQVGITPRPTPGSLPAAGARTCQEGEHRASTEPFAAADGANPTGTPAALFAGIGDGGREGEGGQAAGQVAGAAGAADAAPPLGGSGEVVTEGKPRGSWGSQPGSPAQLVALETGDAEAAVQRAREECTHAGVAQRTPVGSTTPFELVLVGGAGLGDGGSPGDAAPSAEAPGAAEGSNEDVPVAQSTPARAVDMGAQTGLSLGRPARASDGAPQRNRGSSGMATPAASLRAPAGCSLFDGAAFGACSPLAHPHKPQPQVPRSSMRVRAAAGANRVGAHGGGAVALARPGEGMDHGGSAAPPQPCLNNGAFNVPGEGANGGGGALARLGEGVDGGSGSNGDGGGNVHGGEEEWGSGWPSCPGTAETIRSLHLEEYQTSSGGDVQHSSRGDVGDAALIARRCSTHRAEMLEMQHSSGGDVEEQGQGSGLRNGNAERSNNQLLHADGQAAHLQQRTDPDQAAGPAGPQSAGAAEGAFGDVGVMHGSLGSRCCAGGQEAVHAAAGASRENERGGGSGSGFGSGGSYEEGGMDGGGDDGVGHVGGVGGSCGGEIQEDDAMDEEQQQQQQEDDMDVEQHDEEDGGARHYGDDEHDELVGGGRMDELGDGQQAPARGRKKSTTQRQNNQCGNGRKSTAQQDLARQKSLTDAGMIEDDTGLRRSSRPRIKPLEYWRNEHKRYGREFKSLPTVLGIETRTPNSQWPALSTGHVQKKSRARTKARTK